MSVGAATREICTFTDTRTAARHCDVPELIGVPLAAAHASLTSSSCALGHVTTTGTPGAGKVQKVIASVPGAYLVLSSGTPVALRVHWTTWPRVQGGVRGPGIGRPRAPPARAEPGSHGSPAVSWRRTAEPVGWLSG
ncbi:MAG TPA: hypothetical protein VMQ40_00530 [Acidimicrobiales bacterium]|nr:hypothetical protein [Acidimicrobiales bacterium]